MKRDDVALVMGVQNPITELIEVMCRSIGFRILHAMCEEDPTHRISSVNERAVLTEVYADNVLLVGFLLPQEFAEDVTDCHFVASSDMARAAFEWIANSANAPSDLPANWFVVELPEALREVFLWSAESGTVLEGGRLVFDQPGNKIVMQIPDLYRDLYALVERKSL